MVAARRWKPCSYYRHLHRTCPSRSRMSIPRAWHGLVLEANEVSLSATIHAVVMYGEPRGMESNVRSEGAQRGTTLMVSHHRLGTLCGIDTAAQMSQFAALYGTHTISACSQSPWRGSQIMCCYYAHQVNSFAARCTHIHQREPFPVVCSQSDTDTTISTCEAYGKMCIASFKVLIFSRRWSRSQHTWNSIVKACP